MRRKLILERKPCKPRMLSRNRPCSISKSVGLNRYSEVQWIAGFFEQYLGDFSTHVILAGRSCNGIMAASLHVWQLNSSHFPLFCSILQRQAC